MNITPLKKRNSRVLINVGRRGRTFRIESFEKKFNPPYPNPSPTPTPVWASDVRANCQTENVLHNA